MEWMVLYICVCMTRGELILRLGGGFAPFGRRYQVMWDKVEVGGSKRKRGSFYLVLFSKIMLFPTTIVQQYVTTHHTLLFYFLQYKDEYAMSSACFDNLHPKVGKVRACNASNHTTILNECMYKWYGSKPIKICRWQSQPNQYLFVRLFKMSRRWQSQPYQHLFGRLRACNANHWHIRTKLVDNANFFNAKIGWMKCYGV